MCSSGPDKYVPIQEPGTNASCVSLWDQAPFPINQPLKANNNTKGSWHNRGNRSVFYKHSSKTWRFDKKKKKKENNLSTLPVNGWHTHVCTHMCTHTGHILHIVFTWLLWSYGNKLQFQWIYNTSIFHITLPWNSDLKVTPSYCRCSSVGMFSGGIFLWAVILFFPQKFQHKLYPHPHLCPDLPGSNK